MGAQATGLPCRGARAFAHHHHHTPRAQLTMVLAAEEVGVLAEWPDLDLGHECHSANMSRTIATQTLRPPLLGLLGAAATFSKPHLGRSRTTCTVTLTPATTCRDLMDLQLCPLGDKYLPLLRCFNSSFTISSNSNSSSSRLIRTHRWDHTRGAAVPNSLARWEPGYVATSRRETEPLPSPPPLTVVVSPPLEKEGALSAAPPPPRRLPWQ